MRTKKSKSSSSAAASSSRRFAIEGIKRGAVHRIARRAGVKRVSRLFFEETRPLMALFVEAVIRDAIILAEGARRQTLRTSDIVRALERQGRSIYGV